MLVWVDVSWHVSCTISTRPSSLRLVAAAMHVREDVRAERCAAWTTYYVRNELKNDALSVVTKIIVGHMNICCGKSYIRSMLSAHAGDVSSEFKAALKKKDKQPPAPCMIGKKSKQHAAARRKTHQNNALDTVKDGCVPVILAPAASILHLTS